MGKSRLFGAATDKQGLLAHWGYRRMAALAAVAMFGVCALDAGNAHAVNMQINEDTQLDFDVSLTYAAAWRADDADSELNSLGNSNFDKGDMINNRLSALIDIDLQYKDYGIFVRPRAYYDEAYNDGKFFEQTQDLHRDKAEILDAFVYGLFEPFGQSLSLRVGKQVASWGESLFILNGVSAAMAPIDATAANTPGTELKDLFLPVGQVFAEYSPTDSLTFSGFYQWEWEQTRIDETGAFFNTNDLVDDGSRELFPLGRGDDDDPDDQGQFGIATRYLAEELNGTEFGLYFINYHEKLPLLVDIDDFLLGAGPYHLGYDEDVKLYGFSVSSMIGDTNVAGEMTYRTDFSVPVVTPVFLKYEKAEILQAQISAISILPQTSFYGQFDITTEIGINRVVGGLDGETLFADKTAWGGTIKFKPTYFQLIPNLDLSIPVTWKFNPDGISSVQGTFDEDNDSVGVSFDFTYKAVYQMGLGYTAFLNDAEDHNKADRDFYSLNLKYTF